MPRLGGPDGDLVVFYGEFCTVASNQAPVHGVFIGRIDRSSLSIPAVYSIATWQTTTGVQMPGGENPWYDITGEYVAFSPDGQHVSLIDLDLTQF